MRSSSTSRQFAVWGGSLLAFLLLLGGVGWGMGWIGGDAPGVEVEVEPAQHRSLTQTVTAFGRAQAEVEVTISPDVSGEIVALPVQEGDVVQAGDLLARLKPDDYQAAVERSEAQVLQAKASLSERRADSVQARQTYDRQKKLHETGVVPESEFQDAKSAYKQAVARLQSARYQVRSAEADRQDASEQLQKTRIFAPMAGTITRLEVERGERVVGTQQRAGTEMMRVSRLDRMELEVDVNEGDVINVANGDTAQVAFDAYPDRDFSGAVTEIANSARIENEGSQNEVTNFPVTVRVLDDPNARPALAQTAGGVSRPEVPEAPTDGPVLRPGMSGTVDIYTETVDDAVAVPIQAVTVRDFADLPSAGGDTSATGTPTGEELREVVFVAEADTARMVQVTTGIADDTHMEIRSGLDGGERIVTGPYSAVSRELETGTRIRVDSSEATGTSVVAASQ